MSLRETVAVVGLYFCHIQLIFHYYFYNLKFQTENSFFELILFSLVKQNSPRFKGPEFSLSCSQEPVTCACWTNQAHAVPYCLSNIHCNFILLLKRPGHPLSLSFHQGFLLKLCMRLSYHPNMPHKILSIRLLKNRTDFFKI